MPKPCLSRKRPTRLGTDLVEDTQGLHCEEEDNLHDTENANANGLGEVDRQRRARRACQERKLSVRENEANIGV